MVGMAAVGLAVVIAAGFVFALNRGDEATVSGVQPVAGSTFSVIGGEANQVPVAARVPASDVSLNIEKYKLELQNAVRSLDIAAQRYEEYTKMLARQHAAQQAKHQAMWDQRFDDMVERFQNQYDGESALTPLQGRF
jgi:hypothetical protein